MGCAKSVDKTHPPPDAKDVSDEIDMLLTIIDDCNKNFDIVRLSGVDWIAAADKTLPAAFAKQFYSEEVNTMAQRFFRETKLMDAIFEITTAAYHRLSPLDYQTHSHAQEHTDRYAAHKSAPEALFDCFKNQSQPLYPSH